MPPKISIKLVMLKNIHHNEQIRRLTLKIEINSLLYNNKKKNFFKKLIF